MSLIHWMATAIAAAPLVAAGQQNLPAGVPHNPGASVSSPAYRSVFDGYRPMQELNEAPDKRWRAANEEVAHAVEHAGHAHEATASAKETPKQDSVPEHRMQHMH